MAFATTDDVAARLGRYLTIEETARAAALVEAASAAIEVVIGRAQDDMDDVPASLQHICVSMTLRALDNPYGFASNSESLGAYSSSQTYNREGGGFLPTQAETQLIRRAVYGTNTGSSRQDATLLEEAIAESIEE